ncbi:response regulator [Anaeroselena agilis]|uniref:Response regulator transcription factor n=1 Tax=Anaeroselena agilis TaxID=3063788 RepID=A0ABU3P741_9FIRM|nr:response regulator transcription factor [Selenomonadales bacterium 4137-cl]
MRILLVDDQALMLEGLRSLLTAKGFTVAGTAQSGAEALMKYEMLRPDLVLMDIQMAGLDGIETTRLLKKEYPEAKVVMLTGVETDSNLVAAIRAGAEGYLLKDMDADGFVRQLAAAAAGEMPFAPGLARRLLDRLSDRPRPEDHGPGGEERRLTERQSELLRLLAEGLTYKEIAARLGLAVDTVRYHIREILAKTQLANRTQLIANASRLTAKP